jgi:hypothetical protein
MRIDVDCSCFLETSTHLQETKLKIVVLLSRVERDKILGEIVNSQLIMHAWLAALRARVHQPGGRRQIQATISEAIPDDCLLYE